MGRASRFRAEPDEPLNIPDHANPALCNTFTQYLYSVELNRFAAA